MGRTWAVRVAMCVCYYIFSATPSTDILRLLKGATTSINSRHSACDSCGHRLHHWEQLSVLSYLLAKGHCRYCGAKIPPQSVILESLTFVMMAGLAVAFRFRFIGVILGFVGYEALKVGFLVKYGKREKKFGEEIAVSLGYNAGFFGLFALMSALTHT